jgi:hypothetical protein
MDVSWAYLEDPLPTSFNQNQRQRDKTIITGIYMQYEAINGHYDIDRYNDQP